MELPRGGFAVTCASGQRHRHLLPEHPDGALTKKADYREDAQEENSLAR